MKINGNFQYKLRINQFEVINNSKFKNLKTFEAIVFDVISSAITHHEKKPFLNTIQDNNKTYYHISWSFILSQYPMMKNDFPGESTPRQKINSYLRILENLDLIEKHKDNQKHRRSYICKGKYYNKLALKTEKKESIEIHKPSLFLQNTCYVRIKSRLSLLSPYQATCYPHNKPLDTTITSTCYPHIHNNRINIIELKNNRIKNNFPFIKASFFSENENRVNSFDSFFDDKRPLFFSGLSKEIKEAIKKQKSEMSFDIFWEAYANKKGRQNAFKKWCKLSPIEQQKAIDFIPAYHFDTPNVKYRKNPETYINQKYWLSEGISENYKNVSHSGYTEKFRDKYINWEKSQPETTPEQKIENTKYLDKIIYQIVAYKVKSVGENANKLVTLENFAEYYPEALQVFEHILKNWKIEGYRQEASMMGANTGLGYIANNMQRILTYFRDDLQKKKSSELLFAVEL